MLPSRAALLLPAAAALASFGIAGYHAGVEWQLWEGPAGCTANLAAGLGAADLVDQLLATPVVRCDDVPWSLFGLSMAGWNALLSLDIAGVALLAFILADEWRDRHDRAFKTCRRTARHREIPACRSRREKPPSRSTVASWPSFATMRPARNPAYDGTGGRASRGIRESAERTARASVLLDPVWGAAGFALGAVTAAMGPKAAMACTIAVEEVIGEHYADQADRLGDEEAELRGTISKFRDDELEHRDIAVEHRGREAMFYAALKTVIQQGCRTAIRIAERV